jgi:hypothetical protein
VPEPRALTALAATLALAVCSSPRQSAEGSPPAAAPVGASAAGERVPALVAAAKALIIAIGNEPRLSKSQLEGLLRTQLVHSPDVASTLRYYEATLATGPFRRIEFREASEAQKPDWQLVVLDVRAGVDLPLDAFKGDLIPAAAAPRFDPAVSSEGAMTFFIDRPRQRTHLQFGARTRKLAQVAFHRGDRPD